MPMEEEGAALPTAATLVSMVALEAGQFFMARESSATLELTFPSSWRGPGGREGQIAAELRATPPARRKRCN
ncbi:hypothetical protein scyTo_0017798 [Scyliorhinus torazame]|uniref:Uncharacterized protein n=1 Tax=Scyliorhinus torazame TaxID=75743 RepID=A0A401Q0M4_SCYTO|nr:hypothetical protein [Scyliorhinus torazame]